MAAFVMLAAGATTALVGGLLPLLGTATVRAVRIFGTSFFLCLCFERGRVSGVCVCVCVR